MRDWGPWDWIGYGSLGIASFALALDSAIASLPSFAQVMPKFLQGRFLGFLPTLFFIIGTIIFVSKEVGLVGTTTPEETHAKTENKSLLITDLPVEKRRVWIKLQFYFGDLAPTEVDNENILTWYALWRPGIIMRTMDKRTNLPIRLLFRKIGKYSWSLISHLALDNS